MEPRLRTLLVTVLAVATACYVGWSIADGRYGVAGLLSGLVIIAVIERSRLLLPEAAVLLMLTAGYVLGNRGFAQIMPVPSLPLLPGEIGLGLASALVLFRGAVERRLPLQLDATNRLLLLWIGLGTGRLLWDVRVHGFMALRDFATVYYAAFFFVTLAIVRHEVSRAALQRGVVLVFALLPPAALLVQAFPDFFLQRFTLRGVPLLYYKGDLLATFLCAGFFLLLPGRDPAWRAVRIGWAAFSLGFGLYLLSRAAMVGTAVGLAGCWLAGRHLAGRTAAVTITLGLLAAAGTALFSDQDIRRSKIYSIYEHVVSLTDFTGMRQYQSTEAADTGGNNQFRAKWWWAVTRDTWDEGPVFGLGFGADLARGFIQDYDPVGGENFDTRSPHSIVVTVLGRMGAVGLTVWLTLMLVLARAFWRFARGVRTGQLSDEGLCYHAVAWVILVSACFGVVLEGPMGAVPFWIMLGLAHAGSNEPAPPPPSSA